MHGQQNIKGTLSVTYELKLFKILW